MKSLSTMQPVQGMGRVLVLSLVFGVIYAATNALVAALLGEMSRLAATWENAAVWMLTGTVTCLSLSPLILHSSWSRRATVFAVWAVLALVRSVGLGIEGALFKPTAASSALVGAVVGIFVQLWIAWLAVSLIKPPDQELSAGEPLFEFPGVRGDGRGASLSAALPTLCSTLYSARRMRSSTR